MTLQEFRDSMILMTPAEFEAAHDTSLADFAGPGDKVRCYQGGAWIIYRAKDGAHWMQLESRDYVTGETHSLQDLESILHCWAAVTPPEPEAIALPDQKAPHGDLIEWAASLRPELRGRLVAALIMQDADLNGGRPNPVAAEVCGQEFGDDWAAGVLRYIADAATSAR